VEDYAGGGLIVRQARGVGEDGDDHLVRSESRSAIPAGRGRRRGRDLHHVLRQPAGPAALRQSVLEAYKARYPGEEVHSYDHYGYEAMNILLSVMDKTGADRDKIIARPALRRLQRRTR